MKQGERGERRDEYRSPSKHFRAWPPEYWPRNISEEESGRDKVRNLPRRVKLSRDEGGGC